MGKLSHIEDIEAREALKQEAASGQQPVDSPQSAPVEQPAQAPEPQQQAADAEPSPEKSAAPKTAPRSQSAAEREEDFHGISTVESFGFGHTALLVLAVAVFIGAAFYVLNYWFHFI